MVRAVGNASDEVREWVVSALEELGPPRGADVEPLAGLLEHDDADVAYWAATLMGRLEAEAAECVADADALSRSLVALLGEPERGRAMGARGRALVHANRGAMDRSAEIVVELVAARRDGKRALA